MSRRRGEERGRPSGQRPRPATTPSSRRPDADRAPSATLQAPVPLAWSAGVALVALVAYLLLAPPVSGAKDACEFTLVLRYAGVAHPTGYPLYVMLGHLFVLAAHALGATWGYAANAWSAVGGAVAVLFVHALGSRLIPPAAPLSRPGRFLAGLLPAALLALNPVWAVEATFAEVYSWHIAWVALAAYVCIGIVRWLEENRRPAKGGEQDGGALLARAACWGAICGLGMAHHLTAAMVVLPLSVGLVIALQRAGRLRAGALLAALGASVIPLLSYAFLFWRVQHPAPIQWPQMEPTVDGVLGHIIGSEYRGFLGYFSPDEDQRIDLVRWVFPYLVLGLPLLGGAAYATRGRGERVVLWCLVAAAVLSLVYAFNYGVTDPSSYFLTPLVLALLGPTALAAPLARGGPLARGFGRVAGWTLGLGALLLLLPGVDRGLARRRDFVGFDAYADSMFTAIPVERGLVFWADDMYYRLIEYQLLRGQKPGLDVENPWALMHRLPRERFFRRYGFDPMEGLTLPRRGRMVLTVQDTAYARFLDRFVEHLNDRTDLPVIVYDPRRPPVTVLPKDSLR